MKPLAILLLAALLGAGTMLLGWWTVPVIAAVYALLRRNALAPAEAMLAALIAWSALFVRVAQYSAFSTLLDRLGKVFPMPGAGVFALALVLVVLLAWSAARVTIGVFGVSNARRA
jgi:hypothetical protein